ncbi:MAG: serine/threonine-protein kinase [Betaproteobacteria bacterium]
MTDPTRLGKYEIKRVLGKGAMGIVYEGFDPHIQRTVAIKTVRVDLLDKDLTEQFLARFKNEARAAGRLHHPNIVGIYEYGEEDSVAFIAMEFVSGVGLREYLERKATFEFGQLVNIMVQLLQALEFAHGKGVVHRDIKPANLIMTPTGELKVADFGIARIDTSELTMDGAVLGTPAYMSPEQCMGRPSDHRSDLFSAAVVFYELLAGEKPFVGTVTSLMYKICGVDPRPPSQVAMLPLPPSIDALFVKALAKSPDERFQQARDFRLALGEALASSTLAVDSQDLTILNLPTIPPPPIAEAAWDDVVLTTAEKDLARYVGPLAKLLVRKAAAQTHDVGELYTMLATNIGDPQERRRFVAEPHAAEAISSTSRASIKTGGHTTPGGRTDRSATGHTHGTRSVNIPAPRPLTQAFVDATVARLAVYLGPIAKIVAKKATQHAIGEDDFVQIVASHIGTQDRKAFLREMGQQDE